jgi:hypothetical protein
MKLTRYFFSYRQDGERFGKVAGLKNHEEARKFAQDMLRRWSEMVPYVDITIDSANGQLVERVTR